MLTVEQVVEQLQNYNFTKVAKAAGVSKQSVYRLMNGIGKPSYDTLKKLSDWLES